MHISQLGIQPYQLVWEKMKQFTQQRQTDTDDELWMLEHYPIYTQGQAGKSEHILNPGNIPIFKSDRGGQVTYHGPGQLIAYVLMDLKRHQIGIKTLVSKLEQVIINVLNTYDIDAYRKDKAPGVYADDKKIASIGLRVRSHCSYHGIALNVDMNLEPFKGIHPCGYATLQMTQIKEYAPSVRLEQVNQQFTHHFLELFESHDSLPSL